MWFYFLGEVIFLATLIVKNWRIYCIFNNKSLKMIMSHACMSLDSVYSGTSLLRTSEIRTPL